MATYDRRLAGYVTDSFPEGGELVELVCKDHVGTYALPFLCRYSDGTWISETGGGVDAEVLGWRAPKDRPRRWR
jgi:hypothetical protein